jgi:dTDP-4-amino-4,6-dideoxygalactose transaminase
MSPVLDGVVVMGHSTAKMLARAFRTNSKPTAARLVALPDSNQRSIPVLRPLLPEASKLLPYLQRMDSSRIYANWGPLVMELSQRLCQAFAVPKGSVVCANSGMSALMGAILASAGPSTAARKLAAMPDFTFTATALAVQLCGYEPLLTSSSDDSWTLGAKELLARPDVVAKLGLVVPVAPFGRLEGLEQWQHFHDVTGVPVVVDAAACFEALHSRQVSAGQLPVILSFHATKAFGTGEGGCVVTTDTELALRIAQCLNFGFSGSRNTALCSLNGKMSEYPAAVGLAELDQWSEKQGKFLAVSRSYGEAFARQGITQRLWLPPEISSSYVILDCGSSTKCDALIDSLASRKIETRRWYGTGLSAHDAFRNCPRLDVHGQRSLDHGALLGLPTAVDLLIEQVERIAAVVRESLAERD